MKDFLSKQYGIYLGRWVISAFVMMPIMILLESFLPLWGNLIVGQIFGSLIFFKIDKWIFKEDTEIDICIRHHDYTPEPSVSERKL
jgi:hypothetical protein